MEAREKTDVTDIYTDWHPYQKGIMSNKADCEDVQMDQAKARMLFNKFGGYYIRWVSDFDQCEPSEFYSIIKDGGASIEDYPSKTRNMIRRCLNNTITKLVDYQEIITGGGTKYIFLN